MFDFFENSGWRFVTSGGTEMTFGLSKMLFAGGAAGAFYVREGTGGPIQRLPMVAAVGGAGLGFSAGGPVTVSVSLPFAPGGGYQIYRNPFRSSPLAIEDFMGSFVQVSAGAGAFVANRNISFMIFGAPTWLVNGLSLGNPGARLSLIAAACQGIGVLWGSAVSSAASVGIEVYTGEILGHSAADAGETG